MHQALSGERGLLFPDAGTNVVCTFGDASASNPDLFEGCEVVASEVIQNQRVAPAPMESRSGAAAWGEDGRLTAWIPNQGAQGTKGALMGMLGLKPDEVRIITPDVGGGVRREVRRRLRARGHLLGRAGSSAARRAGRRRAWRTCS